MGGADWVPCLRYGEAQFVSVPPLTLAGFVIPLVGTGLAPSGPSNRVGAPDVDPEGLTIHRTVGQQSFGLADANNVGFVDVAMRFVKGLWEADGTVEVFTEDLQDGADANESFLHERRFRLFRGFDTIDVSEDPYWSHYDIKVKRHLESSEALCLVVNLFNPFADGDALVTIEQWLRHWVTWRRG